MKKSGSWFAVILLLRGLTTTPSYAHGATLRAEDFLIFFVAAEAGAEAGFLCNIYIPLGSKDSKREVTTAAMRVIAAIRRTCNVAQNPVLFHRIHP